MLAGGVRRLTSRLSWKSLNWNGIRNMASHSVEHDTAKHRFIIKATPRDAKLDYEIPRDGVMDLTHTYVPDEMRGQGIAQQLVDKALSYAAQENLDVRLTCSYTEDYVKKNAQKISSDPSLSKIQFVS